MTKQARNADDVDVVDDDDETDVAIGAPHVSGPLSAAVNTMSIDKRNAHNQQQELKYEATDAEYSDSHDISSNILQETANDSVDVDPNLHHPTVINETTTSILRNNGQSNDSINNDILHHTYVPFLQLRTNRAPPTMAFFRKSWNNNLRWNRNNDHDNNNNIDREGDNNNLIVPLNHPQQDSVGLLSFGTSSNHQSRGSNNVNDCINSEPSEDDPLTSSFLSPQQQQQQQQQQEETSLFDQCYHKYCEIRQILFNPETYEHIQRTIRRSGNYVAYCTVLVMLILVPTVLYRSLVDRKLDIAAIHSARVMVVGTIIMSLRLVYLHLTHWFMPDVQKYVVRILWMVPIYAIQSYLSLRYHHARVYMSTIRDFYEAFVITSFVYYLMELLGGQDSLIQVLQNKDPRYGYHKFPISLVLQPWVVGEEFLLQCKHGVLQYVVFKTTATIIIFICEYCGVYGEGHFEWFVAYPYLCFFQNISVMYALYCLVIFFHACNEELHSPVNWHPLGKFLCIKGVVFFTWWQGVIIFYLRDHGIIGSMGPWSSIDVANGFIDYCIVVEMVGFAIAHSYTFTYTEYLPGRFPHVTSTTNERNNMDNEFSQALLSNDENCVPPQSEQHRVQYYRPPATLPERMRFRDALWSSSVPHETLQDIQRLRAGVVDSVMNQQLQSRGISRGISLSAFGNSVTVSTYNNGEEELVGGGRTSSCDPEVEHPSPDPEAEVSFV